MFYLILERVRKVNYSSLFFHVFSFFFVVLPVCIIIWYSFSPTEGNGLGENFVHLDRENLWAIFRSFWVSILSVVFTFLIAFFYAWFLLNIRSSFVRFFLIMLVSVPLWSSFFVKLLGLKSFFDWFNGKENSTFGLGYVVMGLVYLNLPITIVGFYGSLSTLPKNLINASLDLGNNGFESIFRAVIPYMKETIISLLFMVFINSLTAVTVSDFLNNENGTKMIGQLFGSYSRNFTSDIDRARISVLTLFILVFILLNFGVIRLVSWAMGRRGRRNG